MTDTYSDKVSVNIPSAVLSEIDLLVDGGYYSTRSDFINQAVREALQHNAAAVQRVAESKRASWQNSGFLGARGSSAERSWFLGISGFTKNEIEQMYDDGVRCALSGYGVLILSEDCPEDKLFEVIESIHVRGKVKCTESVRKHYGL